MDTLAFQCPRRDTGSISAPARNVSTSEPTLGQEGDEACLGDVLLDAGDVPGQGADHDFDQRSGHGDQMLTIEASRAMPSQMAAT